MTTEDELEQLSGSGKEMRAQDIHVQASATTKSQRSICSSINNDDDDQGWPI